MREIFARVLRAVGIAGAVAALAIAAAPPVAAAADLDLDVRGGLYLDDSDPFLGVGVLWDLGQPAHWYANPNVEYAFGDGGNILTLNGDVHYDLDTNSTWAVWVGGGPALVRIDPDRGDSETDFGVNLLAGVGMKKGGIRPYAQFKVIIADETEAVAAVGLRF